MNIKNSQSYVCNKCGITFFDYPHEKRQFCSRKCYFDFYKGKNTYWFGKTIPQEIRERISKANKGKAKFKSRRRKQINCKVCNKKFEIKKHQNRKYCSKDCFYESGVLSRKRTSIWKKRISEAKKGKKVLEETRIKISYGKKGKPNPKVSIALKGRHISPKTEFKKGHKPSEKTRAIWRKQRKGKGNSRYKYDKSKPPLCACGCGKITQFNYVLKRFCKYITGHNSKGEKNPNFQNWISKEPYGKKFSLELKEQIRKRDNYTCQECGYSQNQLGYKLGVHHIDFNKKNNNPNNLISLCKSCHAQTNFNRQNWINYFQNKVR